LIKNVFVSYADITRDRYFVSTEGTEINEELVTTSLGGAVVAMEGNLIQNIGIKTGGSDGFHNVRNREKYMEQRAKIAVDLLKAKPVKSGTYNCVINPSLTGVFTHEAFGHFSEADIIENLPAMRAKMQLGTKIGSDILNIVDDATLLNQLGHYKYDDEGVPVKRVQLIKNGVLTGRLHSRRTAAEFGEPVSGHTVAEDWHYAPIVRMGTIFIEPDQNNTFEDLIKNLDNGLYLLDGKGGQTAGENFTFGAQYGYIVENGKIKEMVRDLNIAGNLYKTLADIAMVGSDFTLSEIGGCGKGQTNNRSCYGGPHVLVKNLVVGGV
jgi:TldD protein